ncbi:AAA family ATPase [Saccharothrix texasensis]|uniref:ATPase family protein associated with various cellular activities (AAA) n=1 Tax=Saccharothrix texasensis TaxID=103734 RepID=A0A3N1HH65_9PSEU|nr:ATP-binding protein [Saccharothrix texasensis]ROP41850.1 ATPase family protein associated with various cellular activities (AAA) [Saccharothrix texasensis]
MATADQVKALVKSHAEGDDTRFYSVALQVAAGAARNGHGRFAQELKALVDSLRQQSTSPVTQGRLVAVAQPRGELAQLLNVSYPQLALADMSLNPDLLHRLERVILEQRQADRLRSHGFRPVRRLLLTGAPGTGKTMSAQVLAGELRLPLFVIRLDGLITKFMGETAAKLRLIFDALVETRGVYLFDEVDALAGERTHGNDVGEIRRVLNSFLQFLETHSSDSLLVAATNHPQLLDRAIFRRFDTVIEYPLPDSAVARQVIRNRLATVEVARLNWAKIDQAAEGLSQGEITVAAELAAKDAILTDGGPVTTAALCQALQARKADHIG